MFGCISRLQAGKLNENRFILGQLAILEKDQNVRKPCTANENLYSDNLQFSKDQNVRRTTRKPWLANEKLKMKVTSTDMISYTWTSACQPI